MAEDSQDNTDNDDPIQKYKMLLEDIEKKEEKKHNKDMEMEITWGLGIKDKAEELVKKKMNEGILLIFYFIFHMLITPQFLESLYL